VCLEATIARAPAYLTGACTALSPAMAALSRPRHSGGEDLGICSRVRCDGASLWTRGTATQRPSGPTWTGIIVEVMVWTPGVGPSAHKLGAWSLVHLDDRYFILVRQPTPLPRLSIHPGPGRMPP